MLTTYYFSKEEVKEALLNVICEKNQRYDLHNDNFTIGFLDENDKVVDAHLVQIFDDGE